MKVFYIILLAAVNMICIKGSTVIVTLYAIELGAEQFTIGILIAILNFFPMFFAVSAGKISDRYGARFPFIFGSIGVGVGLFLPFIFYNLPVLFVSQSLIGISFLFIHVSVQNLVGEISSNADTRMKNINNLALGSAIAGIIGPFLTGISIDHVGFNLSYLYLGLVASIPGLVITFFPQIVKGEKITSILKTEGNSSGKSFMDLIKNPSLLKIFILSSIVLAGIAIYNFYLPIYGISIGLSATTIGAILSVHSVAFLIVRFIMPALVKKFEIENVLKISLLLCGVSYLFIPIFEHVLLLATVSFLLGLGLGCCQPLTILLSYNMSPIGRTGEVLGLRLATNKASQVVLPLLFSAIGSLYGVIPVFWSSALLLASGWLINIRQKETSEK